MKIHYHRYSGQYEERVLHVWDKSNPGSFKELKPQRDIDSFGLVFNLTEKKFMDCKELVIKPMKADGSDDDGINRYLSDKPNEVWIVEGVPDIYREMPDVKIIEEKNKETEKEDGNMMAKVDQNEETLRQGENMMGKGIQQNVDKNTSGQAMAKNEMMPAPEELKRLREDVGKYLSEVKQLEERAEILRSKAMIENIAPVGDYVFARKVIDNEIVRLEISYKALRDLIISIQDRQEQSYNELIKADNSCKNEVDQLSERLAKKIEDVKISSGDSILKTKDEFTRAVDKLQGELKGASDGLYGELNRIQGDFKGNIDGVQGELKSSTDKLQGDFKSGIDKLQSDFKGDIDKLQSDFKGDIDKLQGELKSSVDWVQKEFKMTIESYQAKNKSQFDKIDEEIKKIKDVIRKIENDQDVSLSALAIYMDALAEVLDVKTKLTKLGLNNTMERLINRKK